MLNTTKKYLGILLIALFGGFSGARIYKLTDRNYKTIEEKQAVHLANFTSIPPEAGVDFTKAADLSLHAVVHVKTLYEQRRANMSPFGDPFQEFLYGNRNYHQPVEASGSGVIITDDGYIVTNNHVVDGADKVQITLNDKRSYTAKIIGTDPSTDLALLKIDDKGLPFITYGNSDNLKVGEWVLAVGNPFNLTSTVTAGIVSAKARNINILSDPNNPGAIESYIQTDAAVNKGNSGGALVNTKGELVGINSAIASTTGYYAGYSFAVPVNIVKKVMNDLLEYGEVQRAWMGVSIQDVDAKLAGDKGLKELKGVYIAGLVPNGAAESSGLREGDVILKIADAPVNSAPELQEQIGRFRPGDRINITVLRDGNEKVLPVVLKNKNGSTELVRKEKQEIISALGARLETLSPEEKKKLKISNGVKITRLEGGKLRMAGIREGFVITAIDQKEVRNPDDVIAALNNKRGGVLIEGTYINAGGLKVYYGVGL
jgi:serine protease Do